MSKSTTNRITNYVPPKPVHFQWAEPYCFPDTRVMTVYCQSEYTERIIRQVFANLRIRTSDDSAVASCAA